MRKNRKPKNRKPKNLSLEISMNNNLMQIFKDDEFVCIRDKFPKAKFHALIIPISNEENDEFLNLEQVLESSNCFHFFKKLKEFTLKIVARLPESIDKNNLQYGFHAIQTFKPIHMHIISKDFFSPYLKNEKIWNSFNTPYFIHLDDLIRHLSVDLRECRINYFKNDIFHLKDCNHLESLLITSSIKCNICQQEQVNINSLKDHLLTHA